MQRLEFAKVTSNKTNQKTETQVEENMRERKGAILALSRNVLRIENSDTFYVKSESKDIWYFIKYEPYWNWCSCFDNSYRHERCKHIFAVEYSIRKGTLQDVDKLPSFVKRDNMVPKSYLEDEYSF
jgi:hypothetical protein